MKQGEEEKSEKRDDFYFNNFNILAHPQHEKEKRRSGVDPFSARTKTAAELAREERLLGSTTGLNGSLMRNIARGGFSDYPYDNRNELGKKASRSEPPASLLWVTETMLAPPCCLNRAEPPRLGAARSPPRLVTIFI